MPIETKVEKTQVLICDNCGQREEIKVTDKNDWIKFTESVSEGLRLLEKIQTTQRYESFHIPNKKIIYCCGKSCARSYLGNSIELFLAEIAPEPNKPTRSFSVGG
jgi:hypothetical protein